MLMFYSHDAIELKDYLPLGKSEEALVINVLENTNENFIYENFPKLEKELGYEIKSI